MVCDTRPRRKETLQERVADVRRAISRLAQGLTSGRIKARISPQGAIAFQGWAEEERDGVSDACAYRLLQSQGSAMAKAAIARAEAMAGRTVDRKALQQGHHSHDGGQTWHPGHK